MKAVRKTCCISHISPSSLGLFSGQGNSLDASKQTNKQSAHVTWVLWRLVVVVFVEITTFFVVVNVNETEKNKKRRKNEHKSFV